MGCPIFCASIALMLSGSAHMPLPICPQRCRPVVSPIQTFRFSYAGMNADFLMVSLGMMTPLVKLVCISSPVLSRNPVLMKKILSFTARMHSFRFALVRRSSSIIPTLMHLWGRPASSSHLPNVRFTKSTSAGPCIFGFTMYMLPVLLLPWWPRISWSAATDVNARSSRPSGTGFPFHLHASLNIMIPTLRISRVAVPGSRPVLPSFARRKMRSGFSVRILPPPMSTWRLRFIMLDQFS
mmetsp:Transcript_10634/g.30111  ORF Transcript_10634/g.30111 Transcript_10634/m.30111 type:complete len:239 (-) Transcript_10634:972-1688(-)